MNDNSKNLYPSDRREVGEPLMDMASETTVDHHNLPNPISNFMQPIFSRFKETKTMINKNINGGNTSSSSPSGAPVLFTDMPLFTLSTPPVSSSSSSSSEMRNINSGGFPCSGVRIEGVSSSSSKKGGPAFVGQVFSMCDPSGTGLMAVSTHIHLPFLSRAPEWIKKMLAVVTKNEKNGPVFRFFMDLGDAVAYVKRLNIPTGMVGACRLDVAYEHFKEKPHMFKFVPNQKQVKAASRLLRTRRRLEGVPVFTAQNLSIAIAATDGIKWYTPYFFDKNLLDNILEASIDQHFHTLIQNRHIQRRRDVIDENLTGEIVEDNLESLFEPPEVQEALDEMGHPGIPLSVISKAAEIQIFDVVDKVLLGNRWVRKATGIQPKFPYLVDSFEERSAASLLKAMESASCSTKSEPGMDDNGSQLQIAASEVKSNEGPYGGRAQGTNLTAFHLPFGDWFPFSWFNPFTEQATLDTIMKTNERSAAGSSGESPTPSNPLLPKITMVGISTGEGGQMNRASLKQTMEDLTKELEQTSQRLSQLNEDKDPLFVANVGNYSNITKTSSA